MVPVPKLECMRTVQRYFDGSEALQHVRVPEACELVYAAIIGGWSGPKASLVLTVYSEDVAGCHAPDCFGDDEGSSERLVLVDKRATGRTIPVRRSVMLTCSREQTTKRPIHVR